MREFITCELRKEVREQGTIQEQTVGNVRLRFLPRMDDIITISNTRSGDSRSYKVKGVHHITSEDSNDHNIVIYVREKL